MQTPRVIISGGGTGGHIFPALAIANEIKAKYPDADILFVGAKGKMEMEKVPEAGYPIEGLWISGIQRKLTLDNLSFPFKLASSLLKARKIIRKFRPHVAIGVGGFASGPLLQAANMLSIPTLIQEQNSYPGITNRLLASKATRICVAYSGMDKWFPKDKVVITGNPLRPAMVDITGKKEKALEHFKLTKDRLTVLAVGGSLGARTINQALLEVLDQFKEKNIQLIWQTGKHFHEQANEANEKAGYNGIINRPFIKEMDLAYAAADLIISRAGAMSIAELSIIGKACVLVPLPHAAEDHQTKNAMALVENKAAVLVKDAQAVEELGPVVFHLLEDPKQMHEMGKALIQLGKPDAAAHIVKEIERIAANSGKPWS